MNYLFSQKIVQIADSIQSVLIAKTPVAWNLMLTSVRIDCIGNLIIGLAIFFLSVLSFWGILKFNKKEKEDLEGWQIFLFFVSLFCFSLSIFYLFNIWNIAGIFYPDVYIAHQVLQKVVS